MRTVTAETTAWLTGGYGPESLNGDHVDVIGTLSYYQHDMTMRGWTKVGTATITVQIEDEEKIVENKIESLKAEKNSILAEAQMKATKIDGQIQNLLAITYVPEEA